MSRTFEATAARFPSSSHRARGAFIYGRDGGRYLDFLSGAGSLNFGHNDPVIKQAVIAYMERDGIVHGLDMSAVAKRDFIEAFQDIILKPRGLEYKMQFTGPTGANAVEASFKLARKITGRTNIVAFTNGFHGVSLGSLAATGNSGFRNASGIPLGGVTFMPYDRYHGDDVDTIDLFRRNLEDPGSGLDKPAAVIVECVQGEGGANAARPAWLRRLRTLCDDHEMLLIVDDIQAGVGRTGTFFSFEESGIVPDMVLLSKSLGGMGMPVALTLMRPKWDQWSPSEHNGTFRGNNLAFVAAATMIENYWSDDSFADDVKRKAAYVTKRLDRIVDAWPHDLCRTGRGMLQGLSFADAEKATAVARACFKDDLIIETAGPHDEVVKLLPPLVIEESLLEEGIDILTTAIEKILGAPEQEVVETPSLEEVYQ